jgi:hypothetical protein
VDPCEFVLEKGRDAFETLVASAGDPLDYRLDEAIASLAPDAGDDASLAAVESVLAALAKVAAQSSLTPSQSRLREDQVVGRLSRRFGLSREALRSRMLALRTTSGKRSGTAATRSDTNDDGDAMAPSPGLMRRLPAWDREVIEVLVGVPDAAGLIVREVQSAELETQEGRAVLEAARRLHAEGREIALAGLLLEIHDPAVQSLLVAVDETSATRTPLDSQERVHHLEDALRRRSAQRQAHRSARTLKTSRLDPGSEAALLEQLVAQRRAVQGMTDVDKGMTEPKDG